MLLAVAEMSYVAHQWNTIGKESLPDVDLMAPLIKAATFVSRNDFVWSKH